MIAASNAKIDLLARIVDMGTCRGKRPKTLPCQAPTIGESSREGGSSKGCTGKGHNEKRCDAHESGKKESGGAADRYTRAKLTSNAHWQDPHWLDQEGGHHQGAVTYVPHS